MKVKIRVLIAGIGGASLGTEILKCLLLANRYTIFGCDISKFAFGHYQEGFKKTFLAKKENYIESVLELCSKEGISFIIPGGEEPMVLLGEATERLAEQGVRLVSNSPEVIKIFSDKEKTFALLSRLGFQIPLTKTVFNHNEIEDMPFPCVVKPASGTGGSSFVFLAGDKNEAQMYIEYLLKNGKSAIIQEYIPKDEGEYTVGVLSLPNCQVVGAVVLKRLFNSKLSVSLQSKYGLISSGYSQGLIDDFPEIRSMAEKIARAVNSKGPINIQGRVKNGTFIPFEINPRFSATTYLRAKAGFNEVDIYLQYLAHGSYNELINIRAGYYLRSLSEVFVSKDGIKK